MNSSIRPDGDIVLESPGLPPLTTAAPVEFDGPGDRWSPETLLVAAVADCFLLTFRGIARGSKMPWMSINCDVTGTLERIDRVTRFTELTIHARVRLPDDLHEEQAQRVMMRAEETCLITRSLSAVVHLDAEVEVAVTV